MSNKSVLIIDDDQDLRLTLAEILVEQGYKIQTARDGVSAMDFLKDKKDLPHLILLDVNMPRMNGWQVKEELNKFSSFKDIPSLFISGSALPQLGHEILHKPFSRMELLDKVEKLLRQ